MHDATGCAVGYSIETFSGRFVDITDIKPEDISIMDIAHSLSLQCRFNGHCSRFLSVAEHCYHVSKVIAPEMAFIGLLHDASESYLCDIPRPLKPLLDNYYEIEKVVQDAIYTKYGIGLFDHDELKTADNTILKAEASILVSSGGKQWNMENVPWYDPLMIQFWTPEEAKRKFIERFAELY